ncbi:MAG: hypothetical protein IKX38_03895 [Bacteroidales bacterium]|nr:hypothetical protein [Bacteroidales bacterium]
MRLQQCDRLPRYYDRLPQCDSPTVPDDDGNHEDWDVGLPYHDSLIVLRQSHHITAAD